MTTSENAIAKASANLATVGSGGSQADIYTLQDGDEQGQYSLGMLVGNEQGGTICVVGSAYMFTDNANQMVSGRNATLFLEIVNQLLPSEDDDTSVVIASKDYSVSYLTVSQNTILVYGILWGIFMPLIMIVIGIVVWAKRRKR